MPKKILIIGMLNSIHMANWIERLIVTNDVFYLFPSRQYRRLHPKIVELIKKYPGKFKVIQLLPGGISAYLEFALDTKWFRAIRYFSRKNRLIRVIRKGNFSKIHGIEIQHAGYLLAEVSDQYQFKSDVIVTNWGSDIFFYGELEEHRIKIAKVLKLATHYSAECMRDYKLATDFGFKGVFLPVVPNSTTFTKKHFEKMMEFAGPRNQIIVKCYGSTFGLGELLLEISSNFLEKYSDIQIYSYSVTPDLYEAANNIHKKYPERFRYSSIENPVSHQQILEEFSHSVIYLGASRSDGISTSFLEAISTGVYPIQTSTSCANEWVDKGISASIVAPHIDSISASLENALLRRSELAELCFRNLTIASKFLDFNEISAQTREFYNS